MRTPIRRRGRVLGPIVSLSLALALPACGKDKAETNTPEGSGKTSEEIAAERAEAAKKAKALGLIDLANQELAAGRYVSARKRAEESLAENPNDADAHAVLGAAAWRAGDFDTSTDAYRKALEIDKENFGAIDGLGRNLQAAGNHEEALALQDVLIATESRDFEAGPCDAEKQCEIGWCDVEANECKPPMQVRPRMTKLWSHYLLLDVDAAVKTTDEIFLGGVGAGQDELNTVTPFATFVRALQGKGPLVEFEGTTGSTDLDLEPVNGYKHSSAIVGGEYARAVWFELFNEARINPELVATLGLEEVGKVTPLGLETELPIVVIPEIKVGELTIKNVPALVDDLSPWAAIGEVPGVLLGRQVMHRIGAIAFDFPGRTITVSVDPPADGDGANDLPLLIIDSLVLRVPATQVGIDGSDHRFWAWWGGTWQNAITMTKKAYLKSGHRPADVENPEDEATGLKMVFYDDVQLGSTTVPGMGGIVLVNTPADAMLDSVLQGTAFELGGYLNVPVMQMFKATYMLGQGKLRLEKPAG
jgi:tetratricopeptide (TPR) repeat protein